MDCAQSPDGQLLTRYVSAPLALLPRVDASVDVVAVVPLQVLSWHRVNLPQGSLPKSRLADRSANRLRAILDGLLEDQLLDDPQPCIWPCSRSRKSVCRCGWPLVIAPG